MYDLRSNDNMRFLFNEHKEKVIIIKIKSGNETNVVPNKLKVLYYHRQSEICFGRFK